MNEIDSVDYTVEYDFKELYTRIDDEIAAVHAAGISLRTLIREQPELIHQLHSKVWLTCKPCTATTSFDVVLSGTKEQFEEVWGLLRQFGWLPNSRPTKGSTSYTEFWKHPNFSARIYFWFASTQCTRVQVGTKMQEVPVYEVRCMEQLQSAGSDLLPF